MGSVDRYLCMSYQPIQADDKSSSQRGLMVVEAAFVTLLFLIFVLGIFEGGRVLSVQQALNNAAREGARIAVMPAAGTSNLPTVAEIEGEIYHFLDAAVVSGTSVMVERPVTIQMGTVATQFTRVTVSMPYSFTPIPLFGGRQLTLSGRALMRNETSP